MKLLGKLFAVMVAATLWHGVAQADLAKPDGQVVLTIGGAVSKANLGKPDHFAASFLKSFDFEYDKAAGFDVAMLEALGTVARTIKAEPWPRAITLEGPRLRDVLDAAGWSGQTLTTLALDGFSVELTAEDIAAHDWILAVKGDGEYLNIGGRGPAWLFYDVPGGQGTTEDEARWPWAVFYIHAE